MRGQVLVEFALTMPVVLLIMLGGTETGFLLISKADQDRRTSVVAEWAGTHPGESWNSVAAKELAGCDVSMDEPLHDVIEVTSRCQYHPVVFTMWSGLPITSRQSAARRSNASPSPAGAASPSS